MPDTEIRTRETSAVRRALAMIQDLESRLAEAQQASRAPLAVVGLGCRFPSGATDGASYWDLLAAGGDGITEVPPERWDLSAYYDPDPDKPGKTNARWGGFLQGVDRFDAALFGISRREAEAMDPQHRLLLEVSWQALEHAGIAPDGLSGSRTGVFVGLSTADYGTLMGAGRDASWIDAYASLGNAPSIAAGRLAYSFGFQGPAMVVDTACSSSLVALHLAVQALRAGECGMALAAGVNLTLSPELTINFTKARMLAADGRCKAFDAAADGYVRGEGCGVLVLKRLSDAVEAGDRVLAVIGGSAVNQDGRSAGLTAPNGPSQEAVIRAALSNAGLTPGDVDYIEAHGTGTSLGDPIELHALASVFAGRDRPLPVGSVKTNIGHTEAAAGMAGLIKAVLMLRHQAVPPVLHFRRLNPNIDLGGVPITIPTSLTAAGLGCIGVSSFGFSGTNGHVILVKAPSPLAREGRGEGAGLQALKDPAPQDPRPIHVLPLSARDPAALDALAAAWSDALAAPNADLSALCHTAGTGRGRFAHRLSVVAADAASARAALASAPHVAAGRPKVAFLCTGQGSTYAGMAAGLAETAPAFRAVLERCDAVMGLDRRLADLFGDAAALARTDYAQPALYAVSAGLGALARSWGIEPVAVLGHSVGEYAAAHLAGVLTLEDGARLIAARGRLMQALPPGGAMAALLGPEAAARALLVRHPAVEIAGVNSPTALTVAGPEAAIDALLAGVGADLIGQKLPLRHAFHSRLLEPMLDGLVAAAEATPHDAPRLPVVGNLDGSVVLRHDPAYWRAHARAPVRFAAGLATLAGMGVTHLLELGATPVLSGFARGTVPGLVALPGLTRPRAGQDARTVGWTALAEAVARLWRDGAPVDWAGYDAPYRPNVVEAPGYAFQRQRYWFQAAPSPVVAAGAATAQAGSASVKAGSATVMAGAPTVMAGLDPAISTRPVPDRLPAHSPGRDGRVKPGHDDEKPGPADWAPGHDDEKPGPADWAPGHDDENPGHDDENPGRDDEKPGRDDEKPGPADWAPGERIELATGDTLFRDRLDTQRLPFLADHVVMGETIVPGASHIVMMLAASGSALRDVVFAAPLTLPEAGCATQILLRQDRIELHAQTSGAWTLHASATVVPMPAAAAVHDWRSIAARCTEDADGPAALHAMLGTRGIILGPSFRGIRRLFRGVNEALVQVELPEGVDVVMPLHSAQLDACFQALGATFAGQGEGGAFLPLAVDQAILHRPFSGPLWAHVQAHGSGGGSTDVATGDVTLFDQDGAPIASVLGLTIKRVGAAQSDPSERWTYQVEWTAELDPQLPAAETLAVLAAAARDANVPEQAAGLAEGLERLAAAYAGQALAQVPELAVVSGQKRLFAHLPTMASTEAPEPLAAALTAAHGERLEIALACRSGRALPAVLRGEADPLAALFGGGDGASVYADPPFARMLNAMVVAALRGAIEALPPGRKLRVLETGAGTGAVLAALQAVVPAEKLDFTFTDVSSAFLEAASERFGPDLARCVPLDIERGPETQGFVSASFDVVVAANVLHATRDLRASLGHAKSLLAPTGMLLLLEAVRRSNWSDLIFGPTPGWWRFADTALRPDHPLIGVAQWQAELSGLFAEVETVASPGEGEQMLAIARGPKPDRETLVWEAPAGMAPLDLTHTALQVAQQALARPVPPALRLVTRGAQPVGDVLSPDQAALIGLGRVIAIEHPELDCKLLDLNDSAPLSLAATAPSVREAAWRDGAWHTPRLIRTALPAGPVFRTSGTHLMTGGLGGIGPLLAAWLLEHGAQKVVLLARTPRPEVAIPDGARVEIGDVTRPEDISRLIGPDLRGVFHLAGSLSDAALLRLTRGNLAAVFAAKVEGGRNLDQAVGDRVLDAFVLFGSSTGLIGNPGQGAHAAANAWLAGLAQARQQRGLAGLCIDWGAWGEAGTLTRADLGQRLVATGAALMPPPDALRALGRAIVSGRSRVLVAAIEWSRFLAGYGDDIPGFFAAVAPPRRVQAPVAPAPVGGDPKASRAALAAFVAAAAAGVLRAAPGEAPAPDAPLNEAGLDSLMALELRKALGTGLDLQLPATLLFNFPTIDALTDHLAGLIGLGETAPAPAAAPEPPPAIERDMIVETVMRMSEAEMAAVIAREFALAGGGHV